MKKNERVKSNILFNNIIEKGCKISNKYFTIFYVNSDKTLFGISAPTKLGNAVVRNKVKRQVRSLVDHNKLAFKKNKNYIIIVKEAFLHETYINKEDALKNLIGEINE